jgi:leader peptidase (prepilin peptidase)/N-methyltransferase
MLFFTVIAFVLGACIGSFLNVLIIRLPKDESIWRRMSHCTVCNASIPPYDNIPVLSYLLLRGRCRACKTRFSAQYFWVELIAGVLVAATFYYRFEYVAEVYLKGFTPAWSAVRAALFPWLADVSLLSLLLAMTWIDARHFIIPLEITVSGTVIGLALTIIYPPLRQQTPVFGLPGEPISVLGALTQAGAAIGIGGGLFIIVRWLAGLYFKREALGLGDVHLMIMLGAYLNWPEQLLTVFLSAVIGSIGGISAKFLMRRTHWRFEIPYGPYIAVGAVIAWFWGARLVDLYLSWCVG